MDQAAPLCAVRQVHDDQVVAEDIDAIGVIAPHLVVDVGFSVAQGGL